MGPLRLQRKAASLPNYLLWFAHIAASFPNRVCIFVLLQIRVKPGPEVGREDETSWLSREELEQEGQRPSKKWVESGSGDVGRLFVEVLSCDKLGNTSRGSVDKCDVFANLVFEDTAVNTDVITNVRSPRWMPWSQRAFIFRIENASSSLCVGVFDHDTQNGHDPIGRISVGINNLSSDTEYSLHYSLYTSDIVNTRRMSGRIRLRVRVEWHNFRKAMLCSLIRPNQHYIHNNQTNDRNVAQFTCHGKVRNVQNRRCFVVVIDGSGSSSSNSGVAIICCYAPFRFRLCVSSEATRNDWSDFGTDLLTSRPILFLRNSSLLQHIESSMFLGKPRQLSCTGPRVVYG